MIAEPWARAAAEVAGELDVDPARGLDAGEVARRRQAYGPNVLREVAQVSVWRLLVNQLMSIIVLLLGVATVVSAAFGEWIEAGAIGAAIALSVVIGFVTELRAVRSMEALRQLSAVAVRVRRSGEERMVPAQELVPGDVVAVEGGDRITADLRIVEASKLEADESALTGESMPVGKAVDAVAFDAPLAERSCMLYKGTIVTRGSGLGIVTATAMESELGRIASLVDEAEQEVTPLEKRLSALGRRLAVVCLAIAAATTGIGIATGKEVLLMIETGVALAVAAIPEGLPIVATMALARGMWRMARQNALINRLSSVETLGATSVIVTDKTGTLTENRMAVRRILTAGHGVGLRGEQFERDGGGAGELPEEIVRVLEIGVLCNNAVLDGAGSGDPLEVALLRAGAAAGIERRALVAKQPEKREEAFDAVQKMMATFHAGGDGYRVAVKGAPESVIEVSELDPDEAQRWLERTDELARDGLRVIAVAQKRVTDLDANPYETLDFAGLIGLADPPRLDVAAPLAACRDAGIRVIMATGDQAVTAQAIGRAIGLTSEGDGVVQGGRLARGEVSEAEVLDAAIFSRVTPEQKLDLIRTHQEAGRVVAMTGDGVNDAPALKKADIGVAMGKRGTDVAREAADMVLRDDSFQTIVVAVRQGRVIFQNIRKFVLYLLSCNVAEILIVAGAAMAGGKLPILPLQILFLNLVTDVFPALALGFGEGSPSIMRYPPRDPDEPVIARRHWAAIVAWSLVITAAVLAAKQIAESSLGYSHAEGVGVAFLTLAIAQLVHVFNVRDVGSGLLDNDVVRSPWVWGAIAICVALVLLATYQPFLSQVLAVPAPDARGWLLVACASLVPLVVGQAALVVRKRYDARRATPTNRSAARAGL